MTNRSGFTLTEITLALSILLVVIVSLVTLTGKTVHVTATSEREQAAIQLATDRTDEVRTYPDYGGLDSMFAKTETSFPTLAGFSRKTEIVRTTTSGNDFKKITVTVTAGNMAAIVRTVVVAAP